MPTCGEVRRRPRVYPGPSRERSRLPAPRSAIRKSRESGWAIDYNGLSRQLALRGVTNRVKTMVTSYCSPIKLEVSGEGTAATARGGLVLLFEMLAAKRLLVGLPRAGGAPIQEEHPDSGRLLLPAAASNERNRPGGIARNGLPVCYHASGNAPIMEASGASRLKSCSSLL